MNHKVSLALLVPIVALMLLVEINIVARQQTKRPQLAYAAITSIQECLPASDISAAFRTLSFGRYDDQQKAVALLKANASRSTACRNQTVTSLMSAMDQPNLVLTGGTPQFYIWHYGTKLLGELKAIESLDLLIAHFELNDGSGFPLNHYPALGGVIGMGKYALPKLKMELKANPNRYTRRHIVFCIGLIGGEFAHQILQQAEESESDPCVTSCIRATLSEFNNKRRPHHISDVGRTKWYTTFLCNGE